MHNMRWGVRIVWVILGMAALWGLSFAPLAQVTARDEDELFKQVVTQSEVQQILKSSSWKFIVRAELSEIPANAIATGAVFSKGGGDSSQSFLVLLYQFQSASQAEAFFKEPVPIVDAERGGGVLSTEETDGQPPSSGDDPDSLITAGAQQARLVKVRMGVRDQLVEDEQQFVLDFRVGQTLVRLRSRLCLAQTPQVDDKGNPLSTPALCFLERTARSDIFKVGLKQLDILLHGR